MKRTGTKPTETNRTMQPSGENAGREGETQGISEATTSVSSTGSAASAGGAAGSAATGLSAGSGSRSGRGSKTGSAITEENGAS